MFATATATATATGRGNATQKEKGWVSDTRKSVEYVQRKVQSKKNSRSAEKAGSFDLINHKGVVVVVSSK